jgi:hypothetical protein
MNVFASNSQSSSLSLLDLLRPRDQVPFPSLAQGQRRRGCRGLLSDSKVGRRLNCLRASGRKTRSSDETEDFASCAN